MANEEQVALLREGSPEWNQWRKEHVVPRIDLIGADFRYLDLTSVNLEGACIVDANFEGANLRFANLRRTNLIHCNLSNANLTGADLDDALLTSATLNRADLSHASCNRADFTNVNLNYADLSDAKLNRIRFVKATLRYANLTYTSLIDSNFGSADLICTNLYAAQVLKTKFSRANLTGACIADWQMGGSTRLEGIRCDYIYRTYSLENGQFTGRLPISGKFAPGEFEKWMEVRKGALDTIDITFTDGINWQELFHSLQRVRERHPEAHIAMRSVEESNGVFVVRFGVESEYTGDAEQQLKADVESQLKLQLAEARGEIRALERSLDNTLEKLSMASKNTVIHGGGNILIDDNHGNITAKVQNHYGQDADTILEKLTALREYAQSFPEEEKVAVQVHVEGLGQDLQQPQKSSTARLKTRLAGLLGVAIALGTGIATATDFANNVLELADKLAVPTDALQPQLQQLRAIYPEFDWQQPE